MTGRIIFLLEEPSMQVFLDVFLPRIFPGLDFKCVPHEGKKDLEKSIPRKLKAWREPGIRFVIVQDNDGKDCKVLKSRLTKLCSNSGRPDTLVRLVCQELESWYIGDLDAIAKAYSDLSVKRPGIMRRYADPDGVNRPFQEICRLAPGFQKQQGARLIGSHLSRQRNRSRSFRVFLDGVERLARSMEFGG